MDKNGYNPSIIQQDTSCCYLCGRSAGKLDRHEPLQGFNRQKSKRYGLWVVLCHRPCHMQIAHGDPAVANRLKREAQQAAMTHYGWTTDEFIGLFGRNFIC